MERYDHCSSVTFKIWFVIPSISSTSMTFSIVCFQFKSWVRIWITKPNLEYLHFFRLKIFLDGYMGLIFPVGWGREDFQQKTVLWVGVIKIAIWAGGSGWKSCSRGVWVWINSSVQTCCSRLWFGEFVSLFCVQCFKKHAHTVVGYDPSLASHWNLSSAQIAHYKSVKYNLSSPSQRLPGCVKLTRYLDIGCNMVV